MKTVKTDNIINSQIQLIKTAFRLFGDKFIVIVFGNEFIVLDNSMVGFVCMNKPGEVLKSLTG